MTVRRGLLPLLFLCACSGGIEYQFLAYNPRAEIEHRQNFVLLAPVLEGEVWAYASSAAVASSLAHHYQPLSQGHLPGDAVGAIEEAPPPLDQALQAARETLLELGYQPLEEQAHDPSKDLILSLALSSHDDTSLARVGVHVGGELDGRYRRDLLSLAGVIRAGESPEVRAADLVAELVLALPDREPAGEE